MSQNIRIHRKENNINVMEKCEFGFSSGFDLIKVGDYFTALSYLLC